MFRPEEVEMLVCGSLNFDMAELKQVTSYDGYKADDRTIRFELFVPVTALKK